MPGFTALVSCHRYGDDCRVTLDQIRLVYLAETEPPHAVFDCPSCGSEHRLQASLDLLDSLRDAGAPSDWPDAPSYVPDGM